MRNRFITPPYPGWKYSSSAAPVGLVLLDQRFHLASLAFQFGVIQWVTDRLLVRFVEPRLLDLIFLIVEDKVHLQQRDGSHRSLCTRHSLNWQQPLSLAIGGESG